VIEEHPIADAVAGVGAIASKLPLPVEWAVTGGFGK